MYVIDLSVVVVVVDTDDVVMYSFELATYNASEGQGSVEVCAVPSAALLPGQSVIVLVSTEDGTAVGKKHILCFSVSFPL